MVRDIVNFLRLVAIGRIAARYDLLDWFGVAPPLRLAIRLAGGRADADKAALRVGQRLAAALQEMGPTFIKLGQSLSTRPDFVGDDVADDLAELRDRLPPFPGEQARALIASEFDAPLESMFQSFDDNPVAAASIAQVHYAVTTEGAEVAVKLLRPGIEKRFAQDVALLTWMADWAERLRPRMRRMRLTISVRNFEAAVAREMDLRFEAAAAAELAQNFQGDPDFVIPGVDWQRTARRVLTLERINGIPIDHIDEIVAAGIDPTRVVELAADAFFKMVFRDGFFHADLHPGNLFVGPRGEIVAVDFGITGRLDRKTRRFLGELLLGFLNRDFHRVAQIHFDAGIVPPDQNVDLFTQAVRSIAEPILGRPMHEISVARLLGQLFEISRTFRLEAQPQMLLLQKTMLVAEGVGRKLNAEVNMWALARPLIEDWMADNLGPRAKVRASVGKLIETIESLPRLVKDFERMTETLRAGVPHSHPDTGKDFDGPGRRAGLFPYWAPWILAAILAFLLLRR